MTVEDRQIIFSAIFDECKKTMIAKGKSYAGTEDSLANFKRNAERLGMTPFQVWAIYFNKHIDSINNAIKENPEHPVDSSESIRGRIIDTINYATILECLLVDLTS